MTWYGIRAGTPNAEYALTFERPSGLDVSAGSNIRHRPQIATLARLIGQARAMEHPSGRPAAQTTWATHPFVGLVSSLVILASLLAVAATEWRRWHIGLLVWGLGVAVAAVLYPLVTEKWALHRFLSAEEAAKRRLHKRQQLSGVNMGIIAVGVAVVASGTGWIAVDAVFTALFVVVAGKIEARGGA